jgi:hypothetical protein
MPGRAGSSAAIFQEVFYHHDIAIPEDKIFTAQPVTKTI